MTNYRAITIKYLSPTEKKGARISIKAGGFGIHLPYNYRYNSIEEQAVDHLTSKGFYIQGKTTDDKGNTILLTRDFHKNIKQ
jgi:hypothetical protein